MCCSTLKEGDSGSIVYHACKDIDGQERYKPWGMLVEREMVAGFSVPIYNAVVLNQALEDFVLDYPDLVSLDLHRLPNEDITHSRGPVPC